MSNAPSLPEDFRKELEIVRNHLYHLWGQRNLFVGLFDDPETVNAIEFVARDAGGLIYQAMRTEIAVGLGRLLENTEPKQRKGRKNLSLALLVSRTNDFAKDVIAKLPEDRKPSILLQIARDKYEPLKLWRDRYHGHLDHATLMGLERAKPLKTVDRETLTSLLLVLENLMETICIVVNGGQTEYSRAAADAAAPLLQLIVPPYKESRERVRLAKEALSGRVERNELL